MDEANYKSFDDELQFNGYLLTPDYPEPYSTIITKDIPLAYITGKDHFNYIDGNLKRAVRLEKLEYHELVGWLIKTDKNPSGYEIPFSDLHDARAFIPLNEQVTGEARIFVSKKVFDKSVHHLRSNAYTRASVTRGIGGFATKEIRTSHIQEDKKLSEHTERKPLFGRRSSPSAWRQAEYWKG